MQAPATGEAACGQFDEGALDDAAFMVALLRPRVGEQYLNLIQCRGRNLLAQYIDCVMADHPEIGAARRGGGQQQVTDARAVHFHAEEVALRLGRGAGREMGAVAKADLQRAGRVAAEDLLQAQRLR